MGDEVFCVFSEACGGGGGGAGGKREVGPGTLVVSFFRMARHGVAWHGMTSEDHILLSQEWTRGYFTVPNSECLDPLPLP